MRIEFDLPDDLRLCTLSFHQTKGGTQWWHAHVGFRDVSVMGYSLGSGQECPSAQAAIDEAAKHLRESKKLILANRPTPALANLGLSLNLKALLGDKT